MLKKRWFEELLPFAIGLTTTLTYASYYQNNALPATTRDLFPATLNISAITVGFLATAKSIMFTVNDTRRIRILKEHGSYYDLVDSLLSAIRWSLALSAISAFCLVVTMAWEYAWICVATWLFFTVVAGVRFYQVISTLASILRSKDR